MRIAQIAPTYERVPPVTYGGTELIVHLLTEALVARGHDVTLFASGDSTTSARLRAVVDRPYRYGSDPDVRHAELVHLANAQAAFREAERGEFDVVHNHAGYEGLALAAASATPVLTTTHLDWVPQAAAIWEAYPWRHVQLSRAQEARFPSRGRLAHVHNAIDVGRVRPRLGMDDADRPLLFLGRFTPAKGPHRAIDAARAAGRRLVLAGKVDAADEAWFAGQVAPAIDGDRIVHVGEVGAARKDQLLAEAAGLLFPIDWDEPFGLVVIEALAAGTPVVGFRRASVPELVDDGTTGFVVDDVEGMREAIGRLGELDRRACRTAAETRFGVDRMVDAVLDRYATTVRLGRTDAVAVVGDAPADEAADAAAGFAIVG